MEHLSSSFGSENDFLNMDQLRESRWHIRLFPFKMSLHSLKMPQMQLYTLIALLQFGTNEYAILTPNLSISVHLLLPCTFNVETEKYLLTRRIQYMSLPSFGMSKTLCHKSQVANAHLLLLVSSYPFIPAKTTDWKTW